MCFEIRNEIHTFDEMRRKKIKKKFKIANDE